MEQVSLNDKIVIYKGESGPQLEVQMDGATVWLSLRQMSQLFGRDKSVISRHIKNVFSSAELSQNSVVAKFATTASDGKTYSVEYYNLDMIISVGYRVNSKQGTKFRMWATQRLHDYLLKGYTINEKRLKEEHNLKLKELEQASVLFRHLLESRRAEGYEKDLLKIIADYAHTWSLLNQYDNGATKTEGVLKKGERDLDYAELQKSIAIFKKRLVLKKEAGELFGKEVENKFGAFLENIAHGVEGSPVYCSVEEKAAHLLYFCIKDRPFADGNKRIGSLVFVLYLIQNNSFYSVRSGERRVSDGALAALSLLVSESRPQQKSVIIALITSLINKK